MIDENKLIADQNAGAAAHATLETMGEAFAEVKKQFTDAWLSTAALDDKGREKLWLATTIVSRVEKILRTRVANGRIAEKEIEAIRKAGEPKRVFGIPVGGLA